MHDLGSTVCTQASLCGCTRPERANRLILHIAAYVMHCQLPTAKRRVVQSVRSLCWQEDTQMYGLLGTDCTQTWSFGCISPEGLSYCFGVRGALPAARHQSNAWCSLIGLTGCHGTHRCMT